ncbi:MAG: tyrosine-type recombinase/integrase [Acidimicrobiales bacterium]
MASIAKLSTGWRARYRTPDGASRSRTFPRRVDAERHLASVEHSKMAGGFADPVLGRRTFGSWWEAWRSTRVDLRPSTLARDESYARNHILPKLGKVPLASIDRTMLRGWVAELSGKGLAPATVVKTVQLTSKALAAAADERLIARNPAERLPLPRVEVEEMRFLGPAQVATLAESIDPRYRVWALTAAYTGLRFGELAGLRRGRVDLLRRKLDVFEIVVEVRGHHYLGPPKTRAGKRGVPIAAFIAEELAAWTAGKEPDALVFPAPGGGPLRASAFRRRVWQPAIETAGLTPLRPHDMRHTCVALWIAAGASAKEIAVWAGHSSVATVLDRYGHLLPGQEERVTDALEAMFRAAIPAPSAKVIGLR